MQKRRLVKDKNGKLVIPPGYKYEVRGGDGIITRIKRGIEAKLIKAETRLPKSFQEILNKYGQYGIKAIAIGRQPLNDNIQAVLNIATLGGIKAKLKELGHDNLLHLFMVITLDDPMETKITLEKNQSLNAFVGLPPAESYMEVPLTHSFPGKEDLNEFVLRSYYKRKPAKFVIYNPTSQNCQHFMLWLLEDNGLLTPELRKYIHQDVAEVFSPFLKSLGFGITRLAHIFDLLTE